MTFPSAPTIRTLSGHLSPRPDLGGLALLLGRIPLAAMIFPSPAATARDAACGLYPSVDAAMALALRAGVRAGNW